MNRVGLCFAAIQLFFITTWTVYVIFLPRLAEQAGIGKQWVIFLLMADQVIFAVTDLAMGIAADRVSRTFGRLARLMVGMTAVSCIAFLLLPVVAPAGSPALFLAVTLVWTLTSSALRAPPLVLLGKYLPPPSVPWMATLLLFGVGVAGAIAPYLTVTLRNTDARLPFALSSIALIVVVCGVLWAEKHLAHIAAPQPAVTRPVTPGVLVFFGAIALLGLGFQVHFAINAAPQFLRFAKPADLEYLMPVFWIGFNLLMFPAQYATTRFGGVAVMAVGGLVGAVAAWMVATAGSLNALVTWQFIAGGAWGAVLMSALAAAVWVGRTGREGAATGGLFSLLAIATFARMAIVAAQLNKEPGFADMLAWLPAALWGVAGVVLAVLAVLSKSMSLKAPKLESDPI
ncbi:MAG: MFS transporter [Burkholderiaceae bacterium]